MSAIDQRVASIRMFTVPGRPVEVLAVYQYAAVAADWERLRLRVRHNPLPVLADDERSPAMSVTLQRLSTDLGLEDMHHHDGQRRRHCRDHGLAGSLPNDPGYLYSDTWFQSTERWCG